MTRAQAAILLILLLYIAVIGVIELGVLKGLAVAAVVYCLMPYAVQVRR